MQINLLHIKYHYKQGTHFSSSRSFFWDKQADQKFQENEIHLAEDRSMWSFMGKSRVRTVCRCKGVTAVIKCFPNPIKNVALKSLWERRLCEKRDEEASKREECRFH